MGPGGVLAARPDAASAGASARPASRPSASSPAASLSDQPLSAVNVNMTFSFGVSGAGCAGVAFDDDPLAGACYGATHAMQKDCKMQRAGPLDRLMPLCPYSL